MAATTPSKVDQIRALREKRFAESTPRPPPKRRTKPKPSPKRRKSGK